MSFSLSRLERIYLQVQSAYGTIPNTTGTATVGNSNACRFIKAMLDNDVATIKRPDKTGKRSPTAGQAGRKFGRWSLEQSLAPNGTAGVKPDCDPVIQGFMGAAGAATTSTSGNGFPSGTTVVDGANAYKYTLSESIIPFIMWSFRQPSTIAQRVAHGCVVNRATFQLGQDGAATWNAEGECQWVLHHDKFSGSDDTAKAGLTAFPTEPSAPVTNGGMVVGFTGKAIMGGNAIATLRTASVSIMPANMPVKDTFGSFYATDPEGDERKVTTQFSIYEDDSAAFLALENASHSKARVDFIYQVGTVPGSIMVAHLKGVQLVAPSRDEERRFIANFPEAEATGSADGAGDDLTLWFC
jgi:hypothetical protein